MDNEKDIKANCTKKILLIIIDVVMFASVLSLTIIGVRYGAGDGQVGEQMSGLGYFKPFTIDSNILMAVISLGHLIFLLREIITKKVVPYVVNLLYFVGTVSVTLTFLTVVFFLAPTHCAKFGIERGLSFFTKDMFFYHLLNPLLAIAGYMLIDERKKFGIFENFISIIPMFIYSMVYLFCVAVFKTWSDFYGFTFGGKNYLIPVVLIVMYAIVFLIGFLEIKIKNKIYKK